MIPCKHCNTLNSLDSTFCKRCGTELPEEELIIARGELEKIVDEGLAALTNNRVEEAFAIAESAVASDPSSTKALFLKAACHERRGEISEALECAERIVELNPNSELDKIKRNQLRSALSASVRNQGPSGRWIAALGGVSVAILIICVGVVLARRPEAGKDSTRVAANFPVSSLTDPGRFDDVTQAPSTTGSAPNTAAPSGSTPNTNSPRTDSGSATQGTGNGVGPAQPDRPRMSQPLPDSQTNTLPQVDPSGPIEIAPNTDLTTTPTASTAKPPSKPSGDPPPEPETAQSQPATAAPATDPGQYDIRIHQNNSRIKSSGSQSVAGTTANSAQMFSNIAQNDYMSGNYPAAVTHLEQAIKAGGDAVRLNQRLGMAYGNLGLNSNAASAYQRAIDACDIAIQNGKGDPNLLRKVKDACETALLTVKG